LPARIVVESLDDGLAAATSDRDIKPRQLDAHDAVERIVVNDRRDTGLNDKVFVFEVTGGTEEGLVLFDRIAFVVEDGAAAADPARDRGAGLGPRSERQPTLMKMTLRRSLASLNSRGARALDE
jgi:hypothetical protein